MQNIRAFETLLKLSRVLDININDLVKNEKTIYMNVSKNYIVHIKNR